MKQKNKSKNTNNEALKESYINYITLLLERINDISLLDLIASLLEKSI